MRPLADREMPLVSPPEPGTTEAVALGCTCHVVAHLSATDEAEPSGMLIAPMPIVRYTGLRGPNRRISSEG